MSVLLATSLALAVVRNGQIEKSTGYGRANVEVNMPVRPDTVFQIQSIIKTFTATATMMLVKEGQTALADTITKYLPGLPQSWQDITVRHLLTHTSGIVDFIGKRRWVAACYIPGLNKSTSGNTGGVK